MTFLRTVLSFAALAATTACTTAGAPHDRPHAALAPGEQVAQIAPGGPGMGMHSGAPAYAQQMKAMQDMHQRMLAAKTQEERNALMAAHMALMHSGMAMMGGMGGMGHGGHGAMMGPPADIGARQGMLEQRMALMQSMMQMMMDRMPPVPSAK